MPKILSWGQYTLFFWAGEDGEPVHVHVSCGRPQPNSTKFWLTEDGGCILAATSRDIPQHDLNDLAKLVKFNHRYICKKWAEVFGEDSLVFYR
jgi:hypothetical protein